MLVEIFGDRTTFPPFCACCGEPAQTTFVATATRVTGVRVVRTSAKTWQFPYCHRCVNHVAAFDLSVRRLSGIQNAGCGIAVAIVVLAIFVGFASGSFPVFLLIALLATAGTGIICSLLRSGERERLQMELPTLMTVTCTCHYAAVGYLGWQGHRHSFDVASNRYAFAFMQANLQKLVNVDPAVWNWLHQGQPPIIQQTARKFTS